VSIPSGVFDLLNRLSLRLGLNELLGLDDSGATGLELASGALIGLRYDPALDALVLFADVGQAPDSQAVFAQMLRANLNVQLTGGAALALADDGSGAERVALCRTLSWRALDEDLLFQLLDRFAMALEDWRGLLAKWNEFPITNDQGNAQNQDAESSALRNQAIRG
jgi:hypothetical protein